MSDSELEALRETESADSSSDSKRWRCTPARAGPDHEGARGADLPDHLVRVRQPRARRQSLRAQGIRQHLHPDHEPDDRCVREADRRARRRRRRAGLRLRAGGARRWRSSTSPAPATRSSPPPASTAAPTTSSTTPCRSWASPSSSSSRTPKAVQGRDHRQDQGGLLGDDRQPRSADPRHRGGRRGRPRRRRAADPRQHDADARTWSARSSTAPTSSSTR